MLQPGQWLYYSPTEEYLKIIGFLTADNILRCDYLTRNYEKKYEGDGILCLEGEGRKFNLKLPNWREELRNGHLLICSEEEVNNRLKATEESGIEKARRESRALQESFKQVEKESSTPPDEFFKVIQDLRNKQTRKRHERLIEETPLPTSSKSAAEVEKTSIEFVLRNYKNGLESQTPSPRNRNKKGDRPKKKPTITDIGGAPETDKIELAATIDWLITQGLPALPVAPAFPAEDYPRLDKHGKPCRDSEGRLLPRFTGKNPSYLDKQGRPHLIRHRRFQTKDPSPKEIAKYFAHPCTGIGTLARADIKFIDIDRKNFEDQEDCDEVARTILEKIPGDPLTEQTRSGGWRIGVCAQDWHAGKFGIGDRQFIGEILNAGQFTVLAPTAGYKNLKRANLPAVDLYSVGLEPAEPQNLSKSDRQKRRQESRKDDPFVRFPARLWEKHGPCMSLWLWARFLDKEGRGFGRFTLESAATAFNRKISTIHRWIREAKKAGLCRAAIFRDGYFYFYYSSIHRAINNAGLTGLDAVGLVNFDYESELQNLRIIATEIITADIQKSSRFAVRQETNQKPSAPGNLLLPCEKNEARVLRSYPDRLLVSENFLAYGGTQQAIAQKRGITRRQIQRHHSAHYRTSPSPKKGYRTGLHQGHKKQINQRLPYGCKPESIPIYEEATAQDGKFWADKDGRVWERKPNLYLYLTPSSEGTTPTPRQLIRWRWRRSRSNDRAATIDGNKEKIK